MQRGQGVLLDALHPAGQLVAAQVAHHLGEVADVVGDRVDFGAAGADAWIAERSARWPSTTNPHLLLSRQTAVNDSNAALSDLSTKKPFMAIGVRASALRADRILDEARHTADPIHLIRVFGIAPNTAMHYLRAAHPAQFRPDPIAP